MIEDVYQRVDKDYSTPESVVYYPPGYGPVRCGQASPPTPPPTNVYGDWKVGEFITERRLNFYEGCIVKYVDRHRRKDGKKDLLKAIEYLNQLIKEYD